MQKHLYILFISLLIACTAGAQVCCPDFKITGYNEPCPDSSKNEGQGGIGYEQGEKCSLSACKHTKQFYRIVPDKPGYTYTWLVTGGTTASATGNLMFITWGNGTQGTIKVIIQNQDGSCRDTIMQKVCLQDAPIAAFSFLPASPVCLNQDIVFANNSVGANSYYWDFGDGHSSTLANPSHSYNIAGTYTIMLIVKNGGITSVSPGPVQQEVSRECGCADTLRKTIVVKAQSGIDIIPGCKQMLCKGDTASYCTTKQCNAYQWSVTGGRIIGASNSSCINVVWDGTYPAKVTLQGNCSGSCSNTASIDVPVLYPSMTIAGNVIVCPGSFSSYTVPAMPGTFYKWKLSGGGIINGADSNTSVINIAWGNVPGNYTISCNYHNPVSGCSGIASINIKVLPPYKITGPAKFCVGNSFSFFANGNGNWTITPATGFTPAVFPSANVINGTWNVPGAYIISATPVQPLNYCSYPSSLTVMVLDTPKLDPVKGPLIVCPNSIYTYTANSNMNAGFFSWNITGGNILSYMGMHNDSISVKWNASGPYSISVKQTVEGCSSSVQLINILPFPVPAITSGPSTACMDAVTSYTATGTAPAGNYTWTLNNSLGTIISGQGTNTVTIQWHGSSSSPAIAVLSVTTCGGTDSKTITIQKPPPVTISSNGSLCSNAGIVLTGSVANATSYAWQQNGTAMGSTYNTQSITIHSSGIYKLTITDANGCTASGTINIPAESLAINASLSTTDKVIWYCNETVNTTLHAIPSGSYCYKWFTKPAYSAGPGTLVGTNINYTANTAGLYWCEISICNTSCVAVTDTIQIVKYNCEDGGTSCNNDYTIATSFTGCNPITFTGSAIPAAAANIEWYFGDGHQGNGTTISHQYKNAGNYLVCAVFGGNGYCRKEKCFTVQVPAAADFSASVNCDKVTFTNLSQSTGSATYQWTFTGGSPATYNGQNPPVITYNTGGVHQVHLKMTSGSCVIEYTYPVETSTISASLNIPAQVCANTQAPFTATSSNTGITYQWNFGDGYISNLQNTTHAYATSGSYTVTLIVTDDKGCSKTYTQILSVSPALNVSIGTDKYICPGSTVALTVASSYASYQWYKDGVMIPGATSATYNAVNIGEYWVNVSNGPGCIAASNHIHVLYNAMPVADIIAGPVQCTGTMISVKNTLNEAGVTYDWSAAGPATVTFAPPHSYNPNVTIAGSTPGEYIFVLKATKGGCSSLDTMCITIVKSPTISVSVPPGSLCEGEVHSFIATASPDISPATYFYQWNTGATSNILNTGKPGSYNVTVQDQMGCKATAFAGIISKRPDVSLFPVGCDTLCWTDTLHFPLPYPAPSAYTINWYDDNGTSISNAGTGYTLPLNNLQPGIHHLFAVVSFAGGCSDTTGKFDLYIKDCTLLPPCDNCTGLFSSATLETKNTGNTSNPTLLDHELNITILKPVKEVRISIADLQYSFKDTSCRDCKVNILERGCLFAAIPNQALGTLLPDSTTSFTYNTANTNSCPKELIWKGGTPLPAGTYTIRFKIALPQQGNNKCVANIAKLCVHISLTDEDCKTCEQRVCVTKSTEDDCLCNAGNNWTSLYLVPAKPGGPKPKNLVLCNSTLTGYAVNTPYLLSGQYHCKGVCGSVYNEVTVYNQLNDIIYNKTTALINETITFPSTGMYSVKLTANCGVQKCICSFKIYVADTVCVDCITTPPCTNCPGGGNEITDSLKIDSVITTILPPDFNGEILVSKNDTIIYERYISYKHKVTSHTAFDLASVTKTFTAMAILKLMEEGKLQLDDPVTRYIPGFPMGEITIRMLLGHRSGLEDYIKFMDDASIDKQTTITNNDILKFIINNPKKVLISVPGKNYDYSNTNYVLLSFIIEKASGQTYKDYLTNTFFKPLQMNDTYILDMQNYSNATKSYYKNGKVYALRYLDLIYGDKNIYSTVQDLRKWDSALRKGKLFKKSTLDIAYTAQGTVKPFISSYALGWKKIVTVGNKEILYHTGWWAGSRALIIRLITENVVIAVVSNNNFGNIAEIRRLCDLFGNYQQSNNRIPNF